MTHDSERGRAAISGPPTAGGRVRLRTMILIRWIAIAGQLAAIGIVQFGLNYPTPIVEALIAVGASVAVNIWATVGRRPTERLGDRAAAIYLGYDLIQLAVLLYLTGGLNNPFAILILAPVIVSATVLSRFSTVALSLLAVAVVVVLASNHLPLPWPGRSFELHPVIVVGMAMAMALSVVFIAGYVFSLAEEARRMSDALAATYMALEREQRISSLGALAAAVAHRLGSPLGTIAVVAKELTREMPPESPHRDDLNLLLSESERCRAIMAELSTQPEGQPPFERISLSTLVESAAAPFQAGRIRLIVRTTAESGKVTPAPMIRPRPELMHGLGNLLQNALEFARHEVEVVIDSTGRRVSISIGDDGPGFPAAILDHVGEPYMSGGPQGRSAIGEPMGLGVFIAQTLLARTGAKLRFSNRAAGGAEVRVEWPRDVLEAEDTAPW
ncbi:MAG: ActS/PrrB/RegB family redox-sensitive histidine kinase [Dongiaceae bacterium]